jgi:hypothetical protein
MHPTTINDYDYEKKNNHITRFVGFPNLRRLKSLNLKDHDATERETKIPRHQDAHGEHALAHHTLASQEHLARPANWDSMTRRARKHRKMNQAKHKKLLHK